MVKKGDTLIEVTLAVGIFSMVAISVIAVMVGGTSNAQNSLEITLAREEIDTQAEALRFIHSAYLADENTSAGKGPFTMLWEKIIAGAYTPGNSANDQKFQQYNPTTCRSIYDAGDSGVLGKAFVINPRALANLTSANIETAYISYSKYPGKFRQTATHPRLIFTIDERDNKDSLATNSTTTNHDKFVAEGIFVVAVADPKSTNVVGAGRASTYYDFYIRTCWYGASADTPLAISTVIRLYNPKGVEN